jgi:hypothetical protein
MTADNAPTWMARHIESWHGTRNGYEYHKCRCLDCRAAYALYHRQHRATRPPSPEFTGKPILGGVMAKDRVLRGRLTQDGERTYTAYSADELIEIDSKLTRGRPGHLFG